MEEFAIGLCCSAKSDLIPEAQNIFGALIGEWDIEWIDHLETGTERHIKGEWIFSWILEGIGIQDLSELRDGNCRIRAFRNKCRFKY